MMINATAPSLRTVMLDVLPRALVYCLVFSLVFSAFGCGSGVPREADARQLLEDQIAEQSNGRIDLVSFTKTNGQAAEFGGVDLYTLEWEATLAFDRCLWQPGSFKTEEYEELSGDFSWRKWNRGLSGWEEVEQGTRRDISGEYRYEMTENGWRLAGSDLDM